MSWIQYLWKWMFMAAPTPIRIAEVVFFLVTLMGLAARQVFPKWEPRMVRLAWQLPLAALVVVFIISLAWSSYHIFRQQDQEIVGLQKQLETLQKQLEIARSQASPQITSLMMQQFFKDQDIPLGQFGLVNEFLSDKTFEKCRIHGPAVIYLENGNTITGCALNGTTEANFIITSNERLGGILGLRNCSFLNCEFINISFIGNAKLIGVIKAGFSFSRE